MQSPEPSVTLDPLVGLAESSVGLTPHPASDETADEFRTIMFSLMRRMAKEVGLLRVRVNEIDEQMKQDAARKADAWSALQTAIADVRASVPRGEDRIEGCERRLTELEAGARELSATVAHDLAWQFVRSEMTDSRLDEFDSKQSAVELDLVALKGSRGDAMESRSDAAGLPNLIEANSRQLADLSATLNGVAAAMSDHRARIGCLESKWSISADMIQYKMMIRAMEGHHESMPIGIEATVSKIPAAA